MDEVLTNCFQSAIEPFLRARSQAFSPEVLSHDLFGANGVLDSVDFVSFLVDFEQAVRARTGKPIILSDDRAFSQEKSPFRTPNTLLAYTRELLERAGG